MNRTATHCKIMSNHKHHAMSYQYHVTYEWVCSALTLRSQIVLKFEPPVAHLLLAQAHVGFSVQLLFRIHLTQVNGSMVQRGCHSPRFTLVVRCTEELSHQSTPTDKICENVVRPILETVATIYVKQGYVTTLVKKKVHEKLIYKIKYNCCR